MIEQSSPCLASRCGGTDKGVCLSVLLNLHGIYYINLYAMNNTEHREV